MLLLRVRERGQTIAPRIDGLVLHVCSLLFESMIAAGMQIRVYGGDVRNPVMPYWQPAPQR